MQPTQHKTVRNFIPLTRELVFDVDLTDYDGIRTCCDGASICKRCWPFMTLAVTVLDTALRGKHACGAGPAVFTQSALAEDFGFKHLLWVYSGRRGIHCWVADAEARNLTNEGRSAVAEYLSFIRVSTCPIFPLPCRFELPSTRAAALTAQPQSNILYRCALQGDDVADIHVNYPIHPTLEYACTFTLTLA